MKKNQEMLSSLLKTVQIGQVELRSLLDTTLSSSLRNTLESQLKEYDSIETEAYTIALQRGWELRELDPGTRFLRDRFTRMKLNGRNTDSRIADMLIQRNTRDMIQGFRSRRQLDQPDRPIQTLSQKLLDCETANIRQMQGYL